MSQQSVFTIIQLNSSNRSEHIYASFIKKPYKYFYYIFHALFPEQRTMN